MNASFSGRIHANSLEAFRSEQAKLSKRERLVYDWLERHGPHTDRQVMEGLGFKEPGAVRPRITALIEDQLLMEVSHRKCPTTGKKVRVVGLFTAQPSLFSTQEMPAGRSDCRSMLACGDVD